MMTMKKYVHILAVAAMAALPFALTSCDDDPYWDGPRDDWGWVDGYDNWGWDNNYNDQYDSDNNELVQMAQTLCGEWDGTMTYSEVLSDGSRQTSEFRANMEFYQYGTSGNSLSGNGTEVDYVLDANNNVSDSQTLKFSWYIDEQTGNIYIRYRNSGTTFVLDSGSTMYGFHLGAEQGYDVDTFFGYMIGTNTDDVIYIDLKRQNTTSYAKASGKTLTPATSLFGTAQTRQSIIPAGQQRLLKR